MDDTLFTFNQVFYVGDLTKEIHFPIIQAIPEKKKSLFKKITTFLTYRRKFKVMEDYVIWSEYLKEFIFVPKGFVFDGASVPKTLHSFYSPTGILLLGSCPHDEGYTYGGLLIVNQKYGCIEFRKFQKKTLDKIFRDFCSRESRMKVGSSIATSFVTFGGLFAWAKNRKADKKVIDDFPDLFPYENR